MRKKYTLSLKPIASEHAMVVGEKYRFTVLTESLLRAEYQEQGQFVDEPTQTVICRAFPEVAYRVIEQENSLEIVTEKLHLYYDKKAFSREGLRIELKEGFHVYGSVWNYGDKAEDLKGTARTLDNADGAVELESGILSRNGFAIVDDSKSAFITEDQWAKAKDRESVDLYFLGYGHDYLGCLKDFYHLTGATPLLPRYALGNWWSRYYKYTEESYLALMEKYQKWKIPFSTAVIDMDWHLTNIPKEYGSGWTGYTWNPEYFPNPKRFMDKLHEMGMKVTLNVHPADGVRAHEEAYLPMAQELGIDFENKDKIPFDAGNRKFMDAYLKYLHHPNEERGVDFWWLDWQQGSRGSAPGVDTLWLLNHVHFLDNGRDGKQPLTFSRYAGLGSHRYPVGFSGDTICTWDSLDFQPYFTANASNAGYTWWSHDIGGHMHGVKDDEMMVRWVQFGVFSPIMRLHSSCNEFYGKEPWNYNTIAQNILEEHLRLRHKMIPYLHTMNYLTHASGLPLVQPMYYRHDTPEAYEVPNQYYFGSSMIVCPATKKMNRETMLTEVSAWLPEGTYFDFFGGQMYHGGRNLKLYRDLEHIAVLIPAGSILPMATDYMHSHLENPETLELVVYNGRDGEFNLYEENGQKETLTRITHQWDAEGNTSCLTVMPGDGAVEVLPAQRTFNLRFRGFASAQDAELLGGGTIIEPLHYDLQTHETSLKLRVNASQPITLRMVWQEREIPVTDKRSWIYDRLHKAQISYDLKEHLYMLLTSNDPLVRRLAKLQALGLEENLAGAMVECLTCDA